MLRTRKKDPRWRGGGPGGADGPAGVLPGGRPAGPAAGAVSMMAKAHAPASEKSAIGWSAARWRNPRRTNVPQRAPLSLEDVEP